MKKIKDLLNRPWAAYTFALCTAVVLYMVLSHIAVLGGVFKSFLSLISPILIGAVVAYLFSPVADFFYKKVFSKVKKENTRYACSVILTVVCVVLLLALLLVALIPSLVQSVSKLVSNWSDYTAKLETVIEKVSAFAVAHNLELDLDNITEYLDTAMEKGVDLLKNNIGTILEKVGTIGTGVSNFAIGVVIGFCFLAVRKTIAAVVGKIRLALFRKERIERDNELLLRCHKIFIRYAGCTLLDASIIGIATLIFMLIMRMPYAPLIAVLVAITNIIPTFGPIIGAAFGVFFLILDKPLNAVFFLVFIIIIQALDGTVIKTKLFSGSLGIPGVWTMVIILLGGKVAGIAGIILAIPFAAIFVIIYKETIEPRLERRKNKIAKKSGEKEKTEESA